jgi:hypothetical protein
VSRRVTERRSFGPTLGCEELPVVGAGKPPLTLRALVWRAILAWMGIAGAAIAVAGVLAWAGAS